MASVDQLIASLQGIDAKSFSSEAERIRARDAVFEALRRIQSPWDIAWEQCWVGGAITAAVKTLIDAGVFKKWAEAGGEPITSTRLAELTGADVLLIQRMMRAISGQHLVIEVGLDTYARTPWAAALADVPSFAGMYGAFYHDLNNPVFRALPDFLRVTGFRNPTDVKQCSLQHWLGKDLTMFEYIGTSAKLTSDFNDAMECHSRYNLTPWIDIYPTETIIEGAKEGRPLVVDVGGGKGHDLKKFLARHRGQVAPGGLVLEDLPEILKDVVVNDNNDDDDDNDPSSPGPIRVVPHDFFTPQPEEARGARVYLMHNVLHDWPDGVARQILCTLAPAMEKGYSRLLIHESLVSSERPLSRVTVSDITMMAVLGAAERSEDQWRELVTGAGLRIVKIWRPAQSVESIIEVEVA